MRQSKLKSWGGAVLCCASLLVTTVAWAQNPALGRDYEPVVVPGWHLADWNGVEDLTLLNLYKYVGNGQFETIPFQIDKRRKINLRWNRQNLANGKFPTTNVCEYGYFAEKNVPAEPDDPLYQGTYLDPFLSDILHDKDEIVFLFKDSGVLRADNTEWVSPSSTSIKRYEFILSDLRTHAVRYVYAFLWNQTPVPKSTTNYVTWTPELNPLACTSDEPLEACGVIESQASQLPGLNTFAAHFGGNWITDQFNVKEGGTAYSDIIERFEYKMNVETEESWSKQGNGRRFLGIIEGLVRIVRGVQGAQSGVHTTKYEYGYPTQMVTRINHRVHPVEDGELEAFINHDAGIVSEGQSSNSTETWIWTASHAAVFDKIDGDKCNGGNCSGNDFEDWTETASEVRGSVVWLRDEVRTFNSGQRDYIYTDDLNRIKIGEFGQFWQDLGSTQDGVNNSGACNPGEDADGLNIDLSFARFELTAIPQPVRGDAEFPPSGLTPLEFQTNILLPVRAYAKRQIKDEQFYPPPPPCGPTVSAGNTGTGSVNLSLNTPGCDSTMGYRIYGAEGSKPLAFLYNLGSFTNWTDRNAIPGTTYRYAASAYNQDNDEGSISQEVSILVTDTTPPAIPGGVIGLPGDTMATLEWNENWESDIYGFNVYISESFSGPYTKKNGVPIPAGLDPDWAQIGLNNSQTYYFKVSAQDLYGNESAMSDAVDVTPSP